MVSTAVDVIDGVSSDAAIKIVRGICTANVTLSGLAAITTTEGAMTPADGDRFLLAGQTDATTRLIYQARAGAWDIAPESDGARDLRDGTLVKTQGGVMYHLTTSDPIEPGTTSLAWERIDSLSVTARAVVVETVSALKALSGMVDGQPAATLGYYTPGDGGGGDFYWNAASTATANDGTVLLPTGQSAGTAGRLLRIYSGAINVRWFGAKGDNSANDTAAIQAAVDACFGTAASPNATNSSFSNKRLFFPEGHYLINSPIVLTKVHGGHISGAGRFATRIVNSAGGKVFTTNGMAYTHLSDLYLGGTGSSPCFELDWDNTSGTSLQANEFENIFFTGGSHGIRIGTTGYMGSESVIKNCFFDLHTTAGIETCNSNALQNTVFGGNFQECAIGVLVTNGNVNVYSAGFQINTAWDIKVLNSADDCVQVSGCRSESDNFLFLSNNITAHVSGCNQLDSTSGYFCDAGGYTILDNCISWNGRIASHAAPLSLRNCTFGRSDWLSPQNTDNNVMMTAENVRVMTGGGPNSGSLSALSSERGNHIIGSGNIILAGRNLYDWENSGGRTDTWTRGSRGTIFQFNSPVTSTSNPAASTGYLVEGITEHPQLRNARGYQHLVCRGRVAVSASVATFTLPAKARALQVVLNMETAAGAGTINVGDSGSATRYFNAQTVAGTGVTVSAVKEYGYTSGDTITVTPTGVTGSPVGYVAIDYVVEV